MGYDVKKYDKMTQVIYAGQEVDLTTGTVAPPLFQTAIFVFDDCTLGAERFKGDRPGISTHVWEIPL